MKDTSRDPRRTATGGESRSDGREDGRGAGREVAGENDVGSRASGRDTESLAKENERLAEELRREHDRYLRALADFDNYRKRVDRESKRTALAGKREMILALLNVLDDFERAYAHVEESPASVLEGLGVIHRRLRDLIESQGVTSFESVGEPFDPAQHEAVGTVEGGGQEEGTVVEEVNRGYRWGEELLRPARVRVAR